MNEKASCTSRCVVLVFLDYCGYRFLIDLEKASKLSSYFQTKRNSCIAMRKHDKIPVMPFPGDTSITNRKNIELFCHVINGEISFLNSNEIIEMLVIAKVFEIKKSTFLKLFKRISNEIYYSIFKNNDIIAPTMFTENLDINDELILSDDFMKCQFSIIWPICLSALNDNSFPKTKKVALIHKLIGRHGWNAINIIEYLMNNNELTSKEIEEIINKLMDCAEKYKMMDTFKAIELIRYNNNMEFSFNTNIFNTYIILKYYITRKKIKDTNQLEITLKTWPESDDKVKELCAVQKSIDKLNSQLSGLGEILEKLNLKDEFDKIQGMLDKQYDPIINENSQSLLFERSQKQDRDYKSEIEEYQLQIAKYQEELNLIKSKHHLTIYHNISSTANNSESESLCEYSQDIDNNIYHVIIKSLSLQNPIAQGNNIVFYLLDSSEILKNPMYQLLQEIIPDAAKVFNQKYKNWQKSVISASIIPRRTFKLISFIRKDAGTNTNEIDFRKESPCKDNLAAQPIAKPINKIKYRAIDKYTKNLPIEPEGYDDVSKELTEISSGRIIAKMLANIQMDSRFPIEDDDSDGNNSSCNLFAEIPIEILRNDSDLSSPT